MPAYDRLSLCHTMLSVIFAVMTVMRAACVQV
jgi:hypothetical protein